jgi:hypothetical protein
LAAMVGTEEAGITQMRRSSGMIPVIR